jgi:hypothetical protein
VHLLIDDMRNLDVDVIARTSQAGKALLEMNASLWTHLYLDHDLGEFSDEDAYPVLEWAIEKDLLPRFVQLVTDNPVGREKMARALIANGYTTKDQRNFTKD